MRQTVKQVNKAMQKSILTELSINIDNARQLNVNNRTPYGFVHNLVNETVVVCPGITYENMMNFHLAHVKRGSIMADTVYGNATASSVMTGTTNTKNVTGTDDYTKLHNKAGCPVGSTKKSKIADGIAIIASMNETVVRYKIERDKSKKNKEAHSEWIALQISSNK